MNASSSNLGALGPDIITAIPGPKSVQWVDRLARAECPSLTARRARRAELAGAPFDPIVWASARGANVVDVDGNRFVDLSASFGAAMWGHEPDAVADLEPELLLGFGDVHPTGAKIELLEHLVALSPFESARVILGLNGSDAVSAALKTATLVNGRHGILAFEGGYHGLMHAALAVCGYNEAFREPFQPQLNPMVTFLPYPREVADLESLWSRLDAHLTEDIAAVMVEPMLGRGGIVIPPPEFLSGLTARCREKGVLVISDEIFTGFGRTGRCWAGDHVGFEPDLLCVGKALGGGFPVSACIGHEEAMRAWGTSEGAAIHTGTFHGHPLSCRAALSSLRRFEAERLPERAMRVGHAVLARLRHAFAGRSEVVEVRGSGLMIGIEFQDGGRVLSLISELLQSGYLVLPAGQRAEVLSLTPPLTISEELLNGFVDALVDALEKLT